MTSCGNEVSKWNLRHIRRTTEPLEPVDMPGYANRLSLEKPLGGIDQCVHIPGKADSAYSSFSGGSNIPECPISSCYNEGGTLPSEQLPYMDSGYIRGIYNPIAITSDFRPLYDNKTVEMSGHAKVDSASYSGPYGSTPTHEMLYQPPSQGARPLPPLPHPPPSPPQTDGYNINRNVEQTHPGLRRLHAEQCVQYSYTGLPFDSLANCYDDGWLSRCKNESPVAAERDIWYAANHRTTKDRNPPIVTKPCFMFQEFLTSGSLAETQKIVCAQNSVHTYKIPEEINAKPPPSLHVSHNAVNDIQENKQCFYACSVHKPPFAEAELPSALAVPCKPREQLHRALQLLEVHDRSGLDQDRCGNILSLKYTDSSPPNEAALGIINCDEDRNPCFGPEGETSQDVWQSLLKQQSRMQKPLPHGSDVGESPRGEVYDAANAISYCKPPENSASQMLNGFRKAKQDDYNNPSPDHLTNPRQEEMLQLIHFPKQNIPKKALGQSQDDSASVKINRKTTPLLYYLSGGKNASVVSHRNPAQEQEDFAIKSSRSNHHPVAAEPIEIPKDSNDCVSDTANKNEGLILGSPASSVDEKFKNDYREKLKVAQRKVLRETSFKRKDLQMSLPVRLKQKPSSRPSIQHLRSLSLSSTNEASKSVPPLKPLETVNKEEDSKRPQTFRIGGRRRATKEQKKFSYSEPEKLNQLDDPRDQGASWTKPNARSRSDEINEDTRIIRSKALENQDRALSKAELKQIQHNALLKYMERKIGQRPVSSQSSTQQKPTLQSRHSNPKKSSEDNPTSNLTTSRHLQYIDSFCQVPAPGRILENFTFPSTLTSTASATRIPGAISPVSEMANSKVQPSIGEGNWASKNASTSSLLHSGASVSNKSRGRSKSTPSPMQDIYRSTGCPAFSAQDPENYHTHVSFPSKGEMESAPSDQKDSLGPAQQSTRSAGRRGASVDETGTSEMVRLSPMSQSTDHLHQLTSWHIYSGLETGKNSQGAKHCNILQSCESELGPLPRQSHTEGVVEPKECNSTVQALKQLHGTNKPGSTLFSVHEHPPSMDRFPNVPLEFHRSSPASSPETDNDVFKDTFTSGSEMASHLPSVYRQSKNSTPDTKTPEPAFTATTLQASMEKKQIREEHSSSNPFPETEECNLRNRHGESEEEENSPANSHCLKMAPELPVFFSEDRSNKDSQLNKEISEQSQVSNASNRTQWQQLEANVIIRPLDNWTHGFTSQRGNQGGNCNSDPLVNATTLQTEHDHRFPAQDTKLSIAQSKSPEDQRREDLATEIAAKDKSLVDILMPHPVRKTALDLMEGLFPVSISMLNKSCRKNGRIPKNDPRSSDGAIDSSQETNVYPGQRAEEATYHINHVLRKNENSLEDPNNITSKKRELISSLSLKLQALWDERELIQSEVQEHAVYGKELESVVQELCKPNEYERYLMFIGDLEKVVNLLLCLSSRLARVQNAMEKTDENTDAEEKQSLNERHRLLSRQREDAKDLKENLDRRERVVLGILSKYIPESQLQDFRHFVQAKISLLIEQKHLEEQIKFLEEQLERLEKSIPP